MIKIDRVECDKDEFFIAASAFLGGNEIKHPPFCREKIHKNFTNHYAIRTSEMDKLALYLLTYGLADFS